MNRASPGILGPVRKNETNAPGGGASDRCRPFVSVRVGPVGLPRRRAGRGHRRGLLCTQCFRARAYRQHDKDHDGSAHRRGLRSGCRCHRAAGGSRDRRLFALSQGGGAAHGPCSALRPAAALRQRCRRRAGSGAQRLGRGLCGGHERTGAGASACGTPILRTRTVWTRRSTIPRRSTLRA